MSHSEELQGIFGPPPTLIYLGTDGSTYQVDAEEIDLTSASTRELEILLSLLGYAANKARKELRRRVNQ